MKFTIFTPTFNRAYILTNLYESLKRQTFKDFEWVIVNDGSTDNTEDLVKSFIEEKPFFSINYIKTENGGKHRAINKGVKLACGEMFFIVDSDDYLTDSSLEIIADVENSIPQDIKSEFAGLCGCRGYNNSKIIGTTFSQDGYLDITTLERSKYNISGDKAEIFFTDVLKKYPFPEFEGEKFLTECIVWNKMAEDGLKIRFFNEIIYICEYRNDGLTAQGHNAFIKNPKGWALYIVQAVKNHQISGLEKWNTYLSFYVNTRKQFSFRNISKLLKCNSVNLYIRLFIMRLFYKLYSK